MIPTMMLFGLVFGRWWKTSLLIGAFGWPTLLWIDAVDLSTAELVAAIALGLFNTLVGVAVHQALLRSVRAVGALLHAKKDRHV
jgi:hypothetical protein